jgi:hypothetical protein
VLTFLFALALAGAAVYWVVLADANPSRGGDGAAVAETTMLGAHDPSASATLPDIAFGRPSYSGATWVESSTDLVMRAGAVTEERSEIAGAADYARGLARLDASGPAVVDGEPDAEPQTVVLTAEHQYVPGRVFGTPWTRTPRQRLAGVQDIDSREHLPMYQELVDAAVRADARNVTVAIDVLRGVPVRTYRFDVDAQVIDPGGIGSLLSAVGVGTPFVVAMRVSVDADGLIRLSELRVDDASARAAAAGSAEGIRVPLARSLEVTALSHFPLDIEVPPNFVDSLQGDS